MSAQPIKRTLLHLPYEASDSSLYTMLSSDIRVMRYITEKAESESEGLKSFQKIVAYNQTAVDQTGYYKVFDQEKYIGFSKLSWSTKKEIEIGYMLLPDYWRKGYATKITADLLSHISSSTLLAQYPVFAIIDPNNSASKRVLTKNNFISTWTGIEDGLPSEHLYWQPNKMN